jgi:Mg2+ and Co2+ transporter CorA
VNDDEMEAQMEYWKSKAETAEAERDEARKMADDMFHDSQSESRRAEAAEKERDADRLLLSQAHLAVDAAEAERDEAVAIAMEAREAVRDAQDEVDAARRVIEAAEAEVARLREALTVYAERTNDYAIARAALVRLADIDKDIVAPSATGGEA